MAYDIQTWVSVAAFTGGGMAMGFGAIGAAIGEGYTAARPMRPSAATPN